MNYDLVIPTAPKDYNKAKFCIASAIKHLNPQPQNFFIIYPDKTDTIYINNTKINCVNELEVLNLDKNACKGINRPAWIYQQFLTLFQNASPNNYYLIVDSDLVFNRKFDLFNNEKPQFFWGIDQHHPPYFRFLKQFFNLEKQFDHSFISDMMFFDKKICLEIVNKFGGISEFYDLCVENMCSDLLLSEYELYGNYVSKFYPNLYSIKEIKCSLNGKYDTWSDKEIQELIYHKNNEDYDIITYHSWE